MEESLFVLPQDTFVAGSTRIFTMNTFWDKDVDEPLNIAGGEVYFSLSAYQHDGEPIIKKKAEQIRNDDGTVFSVRVTLGPVETVNLSGKYIYQFSIVHPRTGSYSGRGIAIIGKNKNKSVIT